ncbi:MAG: hypothetical protein GYB65_03720 [Chloroflexi bacterium]|nr:hypothetical protein [Chloroflexota bacterium]
MDLAALPKVELHCHLDGILDRAMLRDIVRTAPDYPLYPVDFERAYPVYDLDSFITWFTLIQDFLERDLDLFRPILARYISRLKAQNVHYAEIMIPFGTLPRDPSAAVDTLYAWREWVDEQEQGVIQIEFMVAAGRNKPPEELERQVDITLALHAAGLVVGFALAGAPEQGYPVQPFHRSFARLHEAGVGIEIHAGEWAGPESVWDALTYGFPDRIGHGVAIFSDERLLATVQERQLHIEMCPTSNLKTGSIAAIEHHPIGQARERNLDFSVNTDDPGPFECSLTSEYELLVDRFGFDTGDFLKIYENSLNARFGT